MLTDEQKKYLSLSDFAIFVGSQFTEDGEYLFTTTYEVPDAEHARHLGPDMDWTEKDGAFRADGYHYVDSYTVHSEL
jgi:hypothetical protein